MAEDAGIKVETTKNAEHERSDAEANPLQKFFLFASWFISFSGWVIYLAGVCLFQNSCQQVGTNAIDCARQFALDWWNCWLAFVAIIVYLAPFFTVSWYKTRVAVVAYMVIVISQLTAQTNFIIQQSSRDTNENVFISGSIIMQAGFYFAILVLGIY
mmetsp:Transcript_1145/g.2017  ORF Transcript_1145/g.2017 Transcript_1145/m.2017 type:complete len:157 (+) Transcript_1145:184-654(+)